MIYSLFIFHPQSLQVLVYQFLNPRANSYRCVQFRAQILKGYFIDINAYPTHLFIPFFFLFVERLSLSFSFPFLFTTLSA